MKRILVVEDEPRILKVLEKRLSLAGYEVITAMDGIAGLELAKTGKPDLVVLDLMLPGMDGREVCWAIRHDPERSQLPILMLTVLAQDTDIYRGMVVGANAYLTKPFDSEVLLARIADLLTQSEVEDAIHKYQRVLQPPTDDRNPPIPPGTPIDATKPGSTD
jgi:DNA-binding response OmpR family regulator